MLTDPIADTLTRMRNAIAQKHRYVDVYYSKLIIAILSVLEQAGFIQNFLSSLERRRVRVYLKYDVKKESMIQELKRVSSPGRRIYAGFKEIPIIRNGLGVAVVSTSTGVKDGMEARNNRQGGELLCFVW